MQVLMDSGADLSVISENLLPADHKQCWPVLVKAVGNQARLYQTALIPAQIDGYALQLYCIVAPEDHVPCSFCNNWQERPWPHSHMVCEHKA